MLLYEFQNVSKCDEKLVELGKSKHSWCLLSRPPTAVGPYQQPERLVTLCLLCKVETALETEKRFINVFIITIFTILTLADEINCF